MTFNPAIQSENYKKCLSERTVQSIVECRFPQTDDIGEILAVYPQVSLSSAEVSSGRINYGGRLICTVIYTDDNGKFCRMQKGVEFTHYCDDDGFAPAQTALCLLNCEKIQLKRDGSSIVISAVIEADLYVYGNCERVYLSGADGAVCKTENITLFSTVNFSGESEIEDEFDADSVVDILVPSAKAFVLRAVCGSGEINVEGEIHLDILAMRGNSPVSFERNVSYKATVPCEASVLAENCTCFAEVKDVNVNATVNEERGKCEVAVVATLGFSGVFSERTEVPAVVDAFCTENETSIAFAEEECEICDGIKTYNERIFGICSTKSKTDYTCNFKATALPRVDYNYNVEQNMIEGAVCALLLYEQNGEDKSTEITLPFAFKLNGVNPEKGEEACIRICANGVSVRRKSEGECEAEAVLKIYVSVIKKQTCRYICELRQGEKLEELTSAISVYMPSHGDTLWDISKKLKKSPQEVSSCNPDLSFPLSGEERIVIYRQKT